MLIISVRSNENKQTKKDGKEQGVKKAIVKGFNIRT